MELASGGELFDQVIDRGANAMSEATGRKFMSQLLAGVHHCHSRGVAHRDLKLENVLIASDGTCKLCDFGSAVLGPQSLRDASERARSAFGRGIFRCLGRAFASDRQGS